MSLLVPELIRRKRDGESLAADEIRSLIDEYTAGRVPDYQLAALMMAIVFRGLDAGELAAWTDAMLRSGEVLSHERVAGAKVDKHSTGGVGDKISLCLAPAVASLGVPVPMISGRGLGHTGGTLDKLEAIPGMRVDLPVERARAQLEEIGVFMIGQTAELAPADRKLYALRDVTATVESIPLIASSIMSKKLAEGIDALVLDVKVGAGAFMREIDDARALAETMIGIGARSGVRVGALLTGMQRPLGRAVGNALEVAEAIEVMRGSGPDDTVELTRELGAEMLLLGGAVEERDAGRERMRRALEDGTALERFARMVEMQGGDPKVCEDTARLPSAPRVETALAERGGWIAEIRPREVARAALEVGAGRRVVEDEVDPRTGVVLRESVAARVEPGRPLADLHCGESEAREALEILSAAFVIADEPPPRAPLILDRV
ncbi:MAG: thymidine phosphorylase [Polyangia bacterium]